MAAPPNAPGPWRGAARHRPEPAAPAAPHLAVIDRGLVAALGVLLRDGGNTRLRIERRPGGWTLYAVRRKAPRAMDRASADDWEMG